ncbi:hypothetical protein BUH_2205 [Burkholderia pseudomallei Pakistan 9]|uniref:Uncharacterized protein n=1 Tax=Burkholderia pseudomallei 1710a TaxID=320371 RepID=A0A0E1WA83_BURPE|nr:hypothetical protein BUH_2205 [Burkholderia pseudomallei Pakistan 9]EET10113.1 hypothetical protein BURPS1710A_2160 [Burkholderia pseudomallei 1710a]
MLLVQIKPSGGYHTGIENKPAPAGKPIQCEKSKTRAHPPPR